MRCWSSHVGRPNRPLTLGGAPPHGNASMRRRTGEPPRLPRLPGLRRLPPERPVSAGIFLVVGFGAVAAVAVVSAVFDLRRGGRA
jgi:hypothetical protein